MGDALAPVGAQTDHNTMLALVGELRTSLAGRVSGSSTLWGADLLDGDDPRSNHILAKFLRSRELSVDAAEKMVLNTLEWRRSYGTDRILDDHSIPECLTKVAYLAGRSRSGHQVLYFEYGPLGKQDAWDAAFNSGNVADGPLIRSRIKLLEQGIRKFDFSKGFDEPTAFVLVHDLREAPLAGVLVSPEASSGIIQMVKTANEYYPDMSIRHVFLHAPSLMSTMLSLLKPFLSNRTQKKLIWAPSGGELSTLLQLIPMTQIPAVYGGFFGLAQPEQATVTEIEVLPGRTETIRMRNMAPGNEARWVVSLAERDVSVRAEFIPLGNATREAPMLLEEREVIVGDTSVEGNGAYGGRYVAKEAGYVRLTFDNGLSWMTTKHVFYATGVRTDPNAEEAAMEAAALGDD